MAGGYWHITNENTTFDGSRYLVKKPNLVYDEIVGIPGSYSVIKKTIDKTIKIDLNDPFIVVNDNLVELKGHYVFDCNMVYSQDTVYSTIFSSDNKKITFNNASYNLVIHMAIDNISYDISFVITFTTEGE